MNNEMVSTTAAFIIPNYCSGENEELTWLKEAIDSVVNQTDKDWIIILVDDASSSSVITEFLDAQKSRLGDKIKIVVLSENKGPGYARNEGIKLAYKLGCPFVLYLDQDDLADTKRLEITRRIFYQESEISVVYSTFQVIDENGVLVDKEKILPSINEILEQHNEPLEGENVWIDMAVKTGYINLTSSTSVRTEVAYNYPFPCERVSEDFYAWLMYSASGAKYKYTSQIPAKYRISQKDSGSRSRNFYGNQHIFNMVKSIIDVRGFNKAAECALKRGAITMENLKDIQIRFFIRKAKSMLLDDEKDIADDYFSRAKNIDYELTKKLIKEY